MTQQRFTFPRWTNLALPAIVIAGSTAPLYFAIVVAYGFSPQAIDVGYMPEQPIPFSHKLHAGELGVDCRYLPQHSREHATRSNSTDRNVHELPCANSPSKRKFTTTF